MRRRNLSGALPAKHGDREPTKTTRASGRWHHDAHRFLKRHRRELATLPVAVFGMGPRTDTEEAWQRSRAQLGRALAKHGWLTPVAVTVFGGADPPGHGKRPPRDLRDWQAIHTWATGTLAVVTLAATLQTESPHAQVTFVPGDAAPSVSRSVYGNRAQVCHRSGSGMYLRMLGSPSSPTVGGHRRGSGRAVSAC